MFHYGTWPAGTRITLCNVTWDSGYANIVNWRTSADRERYFDTFTDNITVSKVTYCAPNRPVRLNVPYSRVFNYNYMVVRNASDIEGATTYYYFINDVSYVAPNTTEVSVQLDVWTTYYDRLIFRRAFVKRGHVARFLDDKYGSVDHREWLCRPEGLDTGSEYLIGDIAVKTLAQRDSGYYAVICSTTDLLAQYGTARDPKLTAANGSTAEGLPNGMEIYYASQAEFKSAVEYLSDYPWVSQGIVSIMAVPKGMVHVTDPGTSGLNGGAGPKLHPMTDYNKVNYAMFANLRQSILNCLPERYRVLKKFATSPFSYVEVTTYTGTPIHVAPEMVSSTSLNVSSWPHLVPPSPRIMFTVDNHGEHGTHSDGNNSHSYHFDAMTGITNLPTFSVTNNAALASLASQAHSIQYARESAGWQQTKALQSAQWSADQSTAAMGLSADLVANSNSAAAQQLGINMGAQNATFRNNTLFGLGSSVVGGAMSGGLAGAASGALTAGVSAVQGRMNLDISQQAAADSLGVSQTAAIAANNLQTGYGSFVRDGNLALAHDFAMGDYSNTIAGINAKIQDAQLTQPSVSGQVGGDAFNLAVDGWKLAARIRIPHLGVIRAIGEFWLRYGYAMGEWVDIPNDLMVMTHFTYWQCEDVNIFGKVPQPVINIMRGALTRGCTVWASPGDIGRLDPAKNVVDMSSPL